MKVAVVGIGKMGGQIAEKFLANSNEVIAVDSDKSKVDLIVQKGAVAGVDPKTVVSQFAQELPVVWLMVPSQIVEQQIDEWSAVLPSGSILIDGGNSNYADTQRRSQLLSQKGISFVDVGTSGGILGEKNGFSLMVGGDKQAYLKIEPLLKALSAPSGGYNYFGQSGSGHFIKMVHNAIEYGFMESLAEGYRLIKEGPIQGIDLGAVADVWQRASVIKSELNGLAEEVLKENPELSGIDGFVAETGEARWAVDLAKTKNIDMPAISAALQVRVDSQNGKVSYATKLLAALRLKFGGHKLNKDD